MRRADNDRYLSVLYAPQQCRAALFALYGFNAEIASVRDRAREPLPGEMRVQWWRDIIGNESTGEHSGYPLAEALLQAIRRHNLPRHAFENYLDARIFDLYDDPMPSRTDLEGYCGETASVLIQLASLILDAEAATPYAELAGHAGCAQAITGLLRLMPIHRSRGQCYIPAEILAASGASAETFLAGEDNAALARITSAMVALAREHLAIFSRGASSLPKSLLPAYLPLALVPSYLNAIDRMGQNAASETAEIAAWKRHWLLFRAASRGFG
ncbi:MAG: phytoene/squalene synthase family protein [Rhizobiaceae bacterium]|nr:phytoene/squalene synthase family protein [Rhizobiaceae bacterium]